MRNAESLPAFAIVIAGLANLDDGIPPRSAADSVVKSGTDVKLDIAIKNVSDRTIYLVSTTAGRNMKIDVRDSEGKQVSETPYGLKVHGTDPKRVPFVGSVFSAKLPIESYSETLVLSKEYDLNKPDTYRVQVSRSDVMNGSTEGNMNATRIGIVNSNTITVTVIP